MSCRLSFPSDSIVAAIPAIFLFSSSLNDRSNIREGKAMTSLANKASAARQKEYFMIMFGQELS